MNQQNTDKYTAFHFEIWLKHSVRKRKEEVKKAAGWGVEALTPSHTPTAQAPMAQLAFLLGLTMILIWPQMKILKNPYKDLFKDINN